MTDLSAIASRSSRQTVRSLYPGPGKLHGGRRADVLILRRRQAGWMGGRVADLGRRSVAWIGCYACVGRQRSWCTLRMLLAKLRQLWPATSQELIFSQN